MSVDQIIVYPLEPKQSIRAVDASLSGVVTPNMPPTQPVPPIGEPLVPVGDPPQAPPLPPIDIPPLPAQV